MGYADVNWGSGASSEMVPLICTKLGKHNPRDLGHITLFHDASAAFTVSIEQQQKRPGFIPGDETGMPIGGYWSEESKGADERSVHVWCPSCRQDMRFRARDFGRLARDTPRLRKRSADVSFMWAILIKERHPD